MPAKKRQSLGRRKAAPDDHEEKETPRPSEKKRSKLEEARLEAQQAVKARAVQRILASASPKKSKKGYDDDESQHESDETPSSRKLLPAKAKRNATTPLQNTPPDKRQKITARNSVQSSNESDDEINAKPRRSKITARGSKLLNAQTQAQTPANHENPKSITSIIKEKETVGSSTGKTKSAVSILKTTTWTTEKPLRVLNEGIDYVTSKQSSSIVSPTTSFKQGTTRLSKRATGDPVSNSRHSTVGRVVEGKALQDLLLSPDISTNGSELRYRGREHSANRASSGLDDSRFSDSIPSLFDRTDNLDTVAAAAGLQAEADPFEIPMPSLFDSVSDDAKRDQLDQWWENKFHTPRPQPPRGASSGPSAKASSHTTIRVWILRGLGLGASLALLYAFIVLVVQSHPYCDSDGSAYVTGELLVVRRVGDEEVRCLRCPNKAICTEGVVKGCVPPFIWSFGGCVKDKIVERGANQMIEEIDEILLEQGGAEVCASATRGPFPELAAIQVDEIDRILNERHKAVDKNKFLLVKKDAFDKILAMDEKEAPKAIRSIRDSSGIPYFALPLSESKLTWSCMTILWIESHPVVFLLLTGSLILCVYGYLKYKQWDYKKGLVKEMLDEVYNTLIMRADASTADLKAYPISHLRDRVLDSIGLELDSKARKRAVQELWPQVERKIEGDSRVRTAATMLNGLSTKAWQWVSPDRTRFRRTAGSFPAAKSTSISTTATTRNTTGRVGSFLPSSQSAARASTSARNRHSVAFGTTATNPRRESTLAAKAGAKLGNSIRLPNVSSRSESADTEKPGFWSSVYSKFFGASKPEEKEAFPPLVSTQAPHFA